MKRSVDEVVQMRKLTMAAAAAAALLLAACGGGSGGNGAGNGGGTETGTAGGGGGSTSTGDAVLTISVVETSASNFDPAMNSVNGVFTLAAVYDTLIMRNSDGTLSPYVATEWEFTDPTTLEMTIRDDVVFSDGVALDAAGVQANIEAARDKGGPLSGQLAEVSDFTIVDETTLQIHLSSPNPSIPNVLAGPPGMLLSPDALDDESLSTTPVGSGPFVLTESLPGQRYEYERRDGYWNDEHFHYDSVVANVFTDAQSQINALISGQAQTAELESTPTLQGRIADGSINYVGAPFNVHQLMMLDQAGEMVPALADERVRQAANFAIDRAAISNLRGPESGGPTSQVFKPGQAGYSDALEEVYPYDPDRARELLAEAGYEDGVSFQMVNIAYFDEPAQAMTGYLAAVGINVEIVNVPIGQYQSSIASGEYPSAFFAFNMNDPYADLKRLVMPDGALNPFGIENAEVIGLYEEASNSTTPEELAAALEAINTILVEEAWWAPTHYNVNGLAHTPNVDGIEWDVVRPPYFYDWRPAES